MLLEYLLIEGIKSPQEAFQDALSLCARAIAVLLGLGAFVGVVVEVSQVGLFFDLSIVAPRASRLNVVSGLQRLFASVTQIFFVGVRLLLLVLVFSWFFIHLSEVSASSLALTTADRLNQWMRQIAQLFCVAAAALLVGAVIDRALKRRKWFQQVGMTHEEMRREMKDDEGDPLYRAQRRAFHHEVAMSDLITRVRQSRVVVVARHE